MVPPHRVLVDEHALAARVRGLAAEIAADAPVRSIVTAGVLTGSFVFLADLVRELTRQGLEPRVELLWASSYDGDLRRAPEVRLLRDLRSDPQGKAVLLVDDILDTGRTLALLRERIAARHPSWLRTCVLLDKPSGRTEAIRADYVGFQAPDEWVFGYGLDSDGEGRGSPDLLIRSHHAD